MKEKLEKDQLINQPYLSKIEIARLLNVPRRVSITIFAKAREIDAQEICTAIYPTKVRKATVLKICGLTKEDIAS